MSTRLRIVSMVSAAGLLAAAAAAPAMAADSETVDVTVTVAAPCITVGPESIDYGVHEFSGPDEFAADGEALIDYQNCGGLAEIVYARASDAIGPAAEWNLGSYIPNCVDGSVNEFALKLVAGPGGTRDDLYFYLSNVDALTDQSLAAGAFGQFSRLWFFMPCTGSDGANEQLSMQVTFTATY